jgi:hypothetical protein
MSAARLHCVRSTNAPSDESLPHSAGLGLFIPIWIFIRWWTSYVATTLVAVLLGAIIYAVK